jgi:hypothetical protein
MKNFGAKGRCQGICLPIILKLVQNITQNKQVFNENGIL